MDKTYLSNKKLDCIGIFHGETITIGGWWATHPTIPIYFTSWLLLLFTFILLLMVYHLGIRKNGISGIVFCRWLWAKVWSNFKEEVFTSNYSNRIRRDGSLLSSEFAENHGNWKSSWRRQTRRGLVIILLI